MTSNVDSQITSGILKVIVYFLIRNADPFFQRLFRVI